MDPLEGVLSGRARKKLRLCQLGFGGSWVTAKRPRATCYGLDVRHLYDSITSGHGARRRKLRLQETPTDPVSASSGRGFGTGCFRRFGLEGEETSYGSVRGLSKKEIKGKKKK